MLRQQELETASLPYTGFQCIVCVVLGVRYCWFSSCQCAGRCPAQGWCRARQNLAPGFFARIWFGLSWSLTPGTRTAADAEELIQFRAWHWKTLEVSAHSDLKQVSCRFVDLRPEPCVTRMPIRRPRGPINTSDQHARWRCVARYENTPAASDANVSHASLLQAGLNPIYWLFAAAVG